MTAYSFSSFGGNSYRIDSLKRLFPREDDTVKISLLIQLSKEFLDSNLQIAKQYAERGERLAKHLNEHEWQTRSTEQLGVVQFRKSNYDSALTYFQEALKGYEENSMVDHLASINLFIGNVYFRTVETEKAIEYYQKSLSISLDNGYELNAAHALNNLGNLYLRQKAYDQAEDVLIQSLEIRKRMGSPDDLASVYNNLGNLCLRREKWEEALTYYQRTLEIDKKQNFKLGISGDYNNIGLIYKNLGDLDKALEYHQHSLAMDEEIGNVRGIAASLNNISTIYILQKKCDLAIDVVKKSLKISSSKRDREIKMDGLDNLAIAYYDCGLFKEAAETQADIAKLKDSIYNERNQQAIADLQASFTKKQQHIQLEKKELEIRRQKQLKYAFIIGFILLTILISILINRHYVKQKLLSEKQQLLLENKALYLQMNPHFIFNSIGAISSFISQNHPKTAIKYLAKFAKLMRNTLENSKRTLISIKDEMAHLENYLLLEQLRFEGQFDFKLNTEKSINQELLIPSMFLQPYVENAILHGLIPKSGKGLLNIQLAMTDHQLICTIEDNGIGRKQAEARKEDSELPHLSSAMHINEKRIQALNKIHRKKMKIEIHDLVDASENPNGTRVVVFLNPINAQ